MADFANEFKGCRATGRWIGSANDASNRAQNSPSRYPSTMVQPKDKSRSENALLVRLHATNMAGRLAQPHSTNSKDRSLMVFANAASNSANGIVVCCFTP